MYLKITISGFDKNDIKKLTTTAATKNTKFGLDF